MENNIIRMDSVFNRRDKKVFTVPTGKTVDEIINNSEFTKDFPISREISVAINHNIIPFEEWKSRKVKEGEYLLFMPKVAGGGDDGKTVLNIVLMIALVAVAGPAGVGLAGGQAAVAASGTAAFMAGVYTTAIVVGGGMVISSLQPRPSKPSSGFIDSEDSQSFGWSSQTIQRQGITIPRMYGKNKVFGNIVSAYTEKEANTFTRSTIAETFYYAQKVLQGRPLLQGVRTSIRTIEFDPRKVNLFSQICESVGPIREPVIEGTMKLNDQPIGNLSNVFFETRNGLLNQKVISYFNNTITEVFVGRIVKNGTPIIHTTSNGNYHNLEIEVAFYNGLFDGIGADLVNNTVTISVEIKKTTSMTWTALASSVAITEALGDKIQRTYTTDGVFTIEFGADYDIRVTKETAERDNIRYGDDLYIDKIREITEIAFQHPRRALVGVKALATEQLSGSLRWSAYARGLYVVNYNDSASKVEYSNNPALVIVDVLTQPVYSGAPSPWLDLKLMLNFEGNDAATSMVDDSPKGHSVTFGANAQLDTAEFKFGSASGLTDGTGDFWSIVNDDDSFDAWENLIEDWTLDVEMKHVDHVGTEVYFGQYVDASNYWYLRHVHGSGLEFRIRVAGVNEVNMTGIGEIADINFHHVAIIKVEDKIGLYKDQTQIDYALMTTSALKLFDALFIIGGQNSTDWLEANVDHCRIHKYNVFSATPVSGLTDTIIEPAVAYVDPGNSFVIERYDGYNPSKLLTADVEDLYSWCFAPQVNSENFAIDSISLAINAVITTRTKHNLKVGDVILFRNVTKNGMVEISDSTIASVIKVPDSTTVVINVNTSSYTAYTLGDRLIYNFEGTDGDTDTRDESTQIHHADSSDFNGVVRIENTQKKWGNTSLYSGGAAGDSLRLADDTDWDIIASTALIVSIDMWVRFDDHAFNDVVIGQFDNSNNLWKIIHEHGTGWTFTNIVGAVTKIDTGGGGEIIDNDFHHLLLAKIGTEIGLYIDGNQVGYDKMVAGDVDTIAGDLFITQRGGGSERLEGYIDGLRINYTNLFGAIPVVGLTDTITKPTAAPSLAGIATIEEYQPRFSFNGIFDTEDSMWGAALKVCELCRCIPFWSGDKIRFAIDKSKIASYAFTMGNTLANSYRELYIQKKDRASEIEVHIRDERKDYARTPFTLMNPDSGRIVNKVRMDQFGITQNEMAQRLANHKLKQLQHIKKMGFWSTDVEGIPCEIGDRVEVQNDATNYGQIGSGDDKYTGGGRVIAASELSNGDTLITIDGEIAFSDADFDGGSTIYKMLVKTKTDAIPEARQITGIDASVVTNGTYDITISGVYVVTPNVDDVWAAGVEDFETIPYILIDLKQSSTQRVDCTGVQYVESIYEDD